jgi:hypothetical protein
MPTHEPDDVLEINVCQLALIMTITEILLTLRYTATSQPIPYDNDNSM